MKRELPLTTAAIASLAAILVVAAGGYFGLVWPARREVTRLRSQLTAATAQAAGAGVTDTLPVTDVERASWQTIETRVRERFVAPDEQFRLLVDIAQLARASGIDVTDIQLEGAVSAEPGQAGPMPTIALPITPPGNLAINPGVIRLSGRHQYRALLIFMDRIGAGHTYVAVQALQVRRVDDFLESDVRLVSLRWAQTP